MRATRISVHKDHQARQSCEPPDPTKEHNYDPDDLSDATTIVVGASRGLGRGSPPRSPTPGRR